MNGTARPNQQVRLGKADAGGLGDAGARLERQPANGNEPPLGRQAGWPTRSLAELEWIDVLDGRRRPVESCISAQLMVSDPERGLSRALPRRGSRANGKS
jgi:hypothetical protein